MSESFLRHQNNATSSPSSPLSYFSSLLRKVKGRLLSVHGLRSANSIDSTSFAASFATLPRTGFVKKSTISKNDPPPIISQAQTQSVGDVNNYAGSCQSISSFQSAHIFATLPRSHGTALKKPQPLTKSGPDNPQTAQPCSPLNSLTLPRSSNGSYFWEEADATKQCRSLFSGCRRALDNVLVAVERYFEAEISPSPAILPTFVDLTIQEARCQEQHELFGAVNSAVTQLFLILVELRNVLSVKSNTASRTLPLGCAPLRQDFVTTALLIPIGALLSHLARLCDLLAISSGSWPLLTPSDSGISMKSTYRNPYSPTSNNATRAHPLKQQTIHVINSLRETLNRIDEGLPVVPVSVVRKSTSINDDLPVSNTRIAPHSTFRTTMTLNTPDDGLRNIHSNSGRAVNTVRLVIDQPTSIDSRGHNKLASLERTLKTVSFESAKSPNSSQHSYLFDSESEDDSSPEYPKRGGEMEPKSGRSPTDLYDNVECYSPGPDYTPTPNKQQDSTWFSSAELFVNPNRNQLPHEIPVVCTGTPSKPMLSPKQQQQLPVWVCRQPEAAPLTPPSAPAGQQTLTNKRSCSQPPPNLAVQAPKIVPLGQGSCQDILLMDHLDALLEFSEKPGEKGLVKSGPVDALIAYASLPSATEAHRTFVDAFLTTYCTFLTPDQLVDKLIYRFEKMSSDRYAQLNGDDARQKLACSTLCLLVHVVSSLSNTDALFRYPSLRSRLAEFVYSLLRRPGLWHLAVALRRELLKGEANLQAFSTQQRQGELSLLTPILRAAQSDASNRRIGSLLDFRSRRIAEQMTLLDWRLFESLDLSELLVFATSSGDHSPSSGSSLKSDVSVMTPRLTSFTRHFNNVSLWARTIILKQDSDKMRERYMLKLAKVVQHLRQMQNFNSSLALLSALDSAAVLRLASPGRVVKRIKSVVNGLRDLTDSSGSFKAYRNILECCHPPAIPYLGLTLSDLTFLHLGCPDSQDSFINFEKRLKQHRILESVRRFKASHAVYNFAPDSDILVFFDNFSDHWDEETCWNQSERIKPRTVSGSSNPTVVQHPTPTSCHGHHHLTTTSCVSSATK